MAKRSTKIKKQSKVSRSKAASEKNSPSEIKSKWNRVIVFQAFLILLAGFWIYGRSLHGLWLWDDDDLVKSNPNMLHLHGLWRIWFATPAFDYWPVTYTVLWIQWHLWGAHPQPYRVVGLLLHLTNGFLVWRLFSRLGLRQAWTGGLLFVIHPLAVESVAWISEIKNTLSLPFFLLSLEAWIDAEEGRRPGYIRSIVYYLAAMLAKSSTVMLPFVFLLYGWWKRGTLTAREISRVVPFFLIAVVLSLFTLHFQAIHLVDHPVQVEAFPFQFIRASSAFFFYLGKFLFPLWLLPVYPLQNFSAPSPLELVTLPLLGAFVFLLGWHSKESWKRHLLLGFGFFGINLFPVLGFLKMTFLHVSWVADHFVYLPMIGLIGLIVLGIEALLRALAGNSLRVATVFLALIGLALAWQSHAYAQKFINSKILWSYDLQFNPGSFQAHHNLGTALDDEGRMPEALEQYEEALKIDPGYFEVHNNLGNVFFKLHRLPESLEQYDIALKIIPTNAKALLNRATARMANDDLEGADADFKGAIVPESLAASYFVRSTLRQIQGNLPGALEDLRQGCSMAPKDGSTDYARLSIWLIRSKLQDKAEADRELASTFEREWNAAPQDWVSQMAVFVLDRITESDLLAKVAPRNQEQACEAWYFIASKHLVTGDSATAAIDFQNCLATGQTYSVQYLLARAELKKLSAPRGIGN